MDARHLSVKNFFRFFLKLSRKQKTLTVQSQSFNSAIVYLRTWEISSLLERMKRRIGQLSNPNCPRMTFSR